MRRSAVRDDGTGDHLTAEVELSLYPLVLCVKVRWFVIVVEHATMIPKKTDIDGTLGSGQPSALAPTVQRT